MSQPTNQPPVTMTPGMDSNTSHSKTAHAGEGILTEDTMSQHINQPTVYMTSAMDSKTSQMVNTDKVTPELHSSIWEVSRVPGVGRVLVAARDILPMEKVLEDMPIVLAPAANGVCLGCMGDLDDSMVLCGQCKWPMCRKECQDDPSHKTECSLMKKAGVVPNEDSGWLYFPVVAILRFILLKQEDPQAWCRLKDSMDHWEYHRKDHRVVEIMRRVTNFLRIKLGLNWVLEEDVQHCFGVLKTNAVDINTGGRVQALYPLASIMSHSCLANLEPLSDTGANVVFRSKRKINRGEELSIRYTNCLRPKEARQKKIREEWLFTCACTRCTDPTELGSHFSNLQCDCGGFYTRHTEEKETKKNIKEYETMEDGMEVNKCPHVCSDCDKLVDLSKQLKEVTKLSHHLDTYGYSEELEDAFQSIPGCHPNFYLTLQLNRMFVDRFEEDSDPERIIDLVRRADSVFRTLRMIEGGWTKLSGIYMMMLMAAQLKLVNLKMDEMSSSNMILILKEITKGKIKAAQMISDFCIENEE